MKIWHCTEEFDHMFFQVYPVFCNETQYNKFEKKHYITMKKGSLTYCTSKNDIIFNITIKFITEYKV